jgi:hypothetical protein
LCAFEYGYAMAIKDGAQMSSVCLLVPPGMKVSHLDMFIAGFAKLSYKIGTVATKTFTTIITVRDPPLPPLIPPVSCVRVAALAAEHDDARYYQLRGPLTHSAPTLARCVWGRPWRSTRPASWGASRTGTLWHSAPTRTAPAKVTAAT